MNGDGFEPPGPFGHHQTENQSGASQIQISYLVVLIPASNPFVVIL